MVFATTFLGGDRRSVRVPDAPIEEVPPEPMPGGEKKMRRSTKEDLEEEERKREQQRQRDWNEGRTEAAK